MIIIIFILGLIVGSFLNAVIHRLHTGESIFGRHSRCPHCGHKLAAQDLVPLISFLVLRGRCRYCHKKISWQYPLVELATAITFTLVYATNVIPAEAGIQFWIPGSSPRMTDYVELLFQLVFVCFLIVIFVYDLKHYQILDKVVLPAALIALVYQILNDRLLDAVYGALFLAGFFLLLYLVSRGRWIGLGDVKLGVFLGLLMPWPATLVLFLLAYTIGALVGLALVLSGRKALGSRVPFGTFLTLSAFLAMIWGKEITEWYLKLIRLT